MAAAPPVTVRLMSTSETTAPAVPEGVPEAAPSVVLPRFAEALRELGLAGVAARVRKFPEATRTAEEAAAAVGCELDAIVKSLIFAPTACPARRGPCPCWSSSTAPRAPASTRSATRSAPPR
ncbi:hypothetical protein Srut_04930 [Streptomyces rutgersensis]|nr:hypothetical protein Srut_04930 [Streptomyces rutgersensis]